MQNGNKRLAPFSLQLYAPKMRSFGKLFLFLFFLSPLPLVQADSHFPQGDGTIRLYNYHLNEFAEIQFRKEGKVIQTGIDQINHLLRSRDNEEIISIDIHLLDLMDSLQDHFKADTIEIISGYRRKELNSELLKTGHSVSPISLHTKGKAIDIHIDEIREETVRDYALKLKLGGVGYYGPLDFVHLDVGPVRQWSEGLNSPRKLIGIIDPKNLVQLKSDKNDYLPGEIMEWEWTNLPSSIQTITLEHFFRGKWNSVGVYKSPEKKWKISTNDKIFKNENGNLKFGKYRWRFKIPKEDQMFSSNEFYLKKE